MRKRGMRRGRRAVAALCLLALLSGIGGLAEDALDELAIVPQEEEHGGDDGGTGEISLLGPEDARTPEPTATPKPTEAPEETKAPEEETWFTSRHYSKSKVVFEKEIWKVLTKKWGLTDYQAAGLMGNIYAESGFSPYDAEGNGSLDDRGRYIYRTDDSVGFGLCQWTSPDRKRALQRYAESRGGAERVWDFDVQMAFWKRELDLRAVKALDSLYAVTEWMVLVYERPNQSYANSWPGTRYERALEFYKKHTGKRYKEPSLSFSITTGEVEMAWPPGFAPTQAADDAAADASPAQEATASALTGAALVGATGTITVSCNYYWRLTLADETVPGWLEIRGANVYHPMQLERCVCGYAQDGKKRLELRVVSAPPPGQSYNATLCFEIYRGSRVVNRVPVTLTHGNGSDDAPETVLRLSHGRASRAR